MNKRILLKSQRNEILCLLKDHGLDPADFAWTDTPSDLDPDKIISRLVYTHTDFFYSFEVQGEAHFAIFSPAGKSYIGTDYPGSWEAQCQCFSRWLLTLIKEDNEPDLWNSLPENPTHSDQNRQQTYVAEPTDQSPDPAQFSTRLDHLLEITRLSAESNHQGRNNQIPIKRYYGKA